MENYVAAVIPHLQQWWPVIILLAYLVGIGFAMVSLAQSISHKHRFNRSTAVWTLWAAVLLLNIPAFMGERFGLNGACRHALGHLGKPGPAGSNLVALFRTGAGKSQLVLSLTIGGQALWAFSTTTEDVAIRNHLYKRMFENAKEALRARIAPTSSHLAALRGDLRKRLQHFKAHREAAEQSALEHDFAQVLRAWGIEDAAHIPAVLRELRLRLLIFALPVLVCAVAVLVNRSNAAWLTLMLIALPCGFGVLTTCWRLSVLSRCRFLSFTRWLYSLVGLAQKGA